MCIVVGIVCYNSFSNRGFTYIYDINGEEINKIPLW